MFQFILRGVAPRCSVAPSHRLEHVTFWWVCQWHLNVTRCLPVCSFFGVPWLSAFHSLCNEIGCIGDANANVLTETLQWFDGMAIWISTDNWIGDWVNVVWWNVNATPDRQPANQPANVYEKMPAIDRIMHSAKQRERKKKQTHCPGQTRRREEEQCCTWNWIERN